MRILVDTPTKLVVQIRDIQYSKPGKVINIVSLIIFTIIFFHLATITKGNILTALLIALCGSGPIFLINSV